MEGITYIVLLNIELKIKVICLQERLTEQLVLTLIKDF